MTLKTVNFSIIWISWSHSIDTLVLYKCIELFDGKKLSEVWFKFWSFQFLIFYSFIVEVRGFEYFGISIILIKPVAHIFIIIIFGSIIWKFSLLPIFVVNLYCCHIIIIRQIICIHFAINFWFCSTCCYCFIR